MSAIRLVSSRVRRKFIVAVPSGILRAATEWRSRQHQPKHRAYSSKTTCKSRSACVLLPRGGELVPGPPDFVAVNRLRAVVRVVRVLKAYDSRELKSSAEKLLADARERVERAKRELAGACGW